MVKIRPEERMSLLFVLFLKNETNLHWLKTIR